MELGSTHAIRQVAFCKALEGQITDFLRIKWKSCLPAELQSLGLSLRRMFGHTGQTSPPDWDLAAPEPLHYTFHRGQSSIPVVTLPLREGDKSVRF